MCLHRAPALRCSAPHPEAAASEPHMLSFGFAFVATEIQSAFASHDSVALSLQALWYVELAWSCFFDLLQLLQ